MSSLLTAHDEAIGEHQERCLVEVRDQAEQEILVAELAEQPALLVGEERIVSVADHDERMAATHEPRRSTRRARFSSR